MTELLHDGDVVLHHGDCIEVLAGLPDASVDSIVTDPPYELTSGKPGGSGAASVNPNSPAGRSMIGTSGGFMGKHWDATGIAFTVELWTECLRILKPGGHLLAFGGTRTYHRMTCAIEDAGFEIRDSITWLYGSGFPKSLDVSKAIDRAAGAEREVVGQQTLTGRAAQATADKGGTYTAGAPSSLGTPPKVVDLTAPATAAAKTWAGWGTALKPASEPICVARKPFRGTVVGNVLEYGTGALNIDGCRTKMGDADRAEAEGKNRHQDFGSGARENHVYGSETRTRAEQGNYDGSAGRWPANVVLSHTAGCVLAGTKRVAATSIHGESTAVRGAGGAHADAGGHQRPGRVQPVTGYADTDGMETVEAWDCADGCPVRELDAQTGSLLGCASPKTTTHDSGMFGIGQPGVVYGDAGGASRFFPTFRYEAKAPGDERPRDGLVAHPTVKPLDLMRWLVRLVTPPGGLTLDPFAGSGTTGEAALREGMRAVLVEREASYLPLIRARLAKPQQAAMF